MAGRYLITIAVLVVGLFLAVSAQERVFQLCPPQLPWCPVWEHCNYTEVQGAICKDCHTRLICTPIGGLVKQCKWPGKRHCVEGECVSEPSDACAPTTPPEPQTETTPEPQTETTPEPQTETTPEPQTETTPEPQTETTVEPPSETPIAA